MPDDPTTDPIAMPEPDDLPPLPESPDPQLPHDPKNDEVPED